MQVLAHLWFGPHPFARVWTQVGADIDGEAAGDRFGRSVSFTNDGSLLAIGALYNDGAGSNAGRQLILLCPAHWYVSAVAEAVETKQSSLSCTIFVQCFLLLVRTRSRLPTRWRCLDPGG